MPMSVELQLQLVQVDEVEAEGRREWAGYGAVATLRHEDGAGVGAGVGARLIQHEDGVKGEVLEVEAGVLMPNFVHALPEFHLLTNVGCWNRWMLASYVRRQSHEEKERQWLAVFGQPGRRHGRDTYTHVASLQKADTDMLWAVGPVAGCGPCGRLVAGVSWRLWS